MTVTVEFERFQCFNFEKSFLKIFFEKLEYCFLVVITTIENTTFPYKIDQPKANINLNRMGRTKCTYHKERRCHYLLNFLENLVSL